MKFTKLFVPLLLVAIALAGCGTHTARCQGKLSPINAPASIASKDQAP